MGDLESRKVRFYKHSMGKPKSYAISKLLDAEDRISELQAKLAAVENLERYAAIVAVGKGKLDYVEAVLDSDLQAALKATP